MDKNFVSAQLRNQFYPILKTQGFTQKADVFRQIDGEIIRIVDIQHSVKRHCFQVNLGIHLRPLGEYIMGCTGKPLIIEKMREYDCAWRNSILPNLINDYDSDWMYGSNEQEAIEMVQFLASEWNRQSQIFFNALAHWPQDFIHQANLAVQNPIHPMDMAKLCHVAAAAGNLDLVKTLAELALPAVPERATSLKQKLESFMINPHLAIPNISP